MKEKQNIIPGYNGIMDLDLTNIDEKFHKELINLHYDEIKVYKKEQKALKPKLRYENSVERVLKQLERDKNIMMERVKEKEREKDIEYQKLIGYLNKLPNLQVRDM